MDTARRTEQKPVSPDLIHEMKAPSGALRRALDLMGENLPRFFQGDTRVASFFRSGLGCPFWENATRHDRRERIRSWNLPVDALLERRLTYLPDPELDQVRPVLAEDNHEEVSRLLEAFELGATLRTARISARQVQRLVQASETTPPYAQTADIAQTIDEALTILDSQLRKVEVVLDLPDMPRTQAVVSEIQQVWVNLILNAAEALQQSDNGRIEISATTTDPEWLEVVVADNGPGIAPERIEQIFEPKVTTKPRNPNPRGIGLAITREIVERHGGTISVANLSDRGTRFVVRLPVA